MGALLLGASVQLWFATPANGANADVGWSTYNNSYSSQRFSPLTEINTDTVGDLGVICELQLGDPAPFQAGPVVVGDTIFITLRHITLAVGATDCAVKWAHIQNLSGTLYSQVNRGVAYLKHRVFRGANDGTVFALDADTGREVWRTRITPWLPGDFVSAAPIAWNGLVFIGTAGGDYGSRGRMLAFDARSGKQLWTFNTVPTGDEPGADSWKLPETAIVGGGGTWSSFSLRPDRAELFLPVGNPAPAFIPSARPGDNLYTESIVVLNARTGKLQWHYQLIPNDGVDYDLVAAPMLFSSADGQRRVAVASKDGYLYVVNESDRRLVFKTPVTTVTGGSAGDPTPEGQLFCPGPAGGVVWNGPAFDVRTRTIIVGAIDDCMVVKSGSSGMRPGEVYMGTVAAPIHGVKATGWITAIDGDTGQIRWRTPRPSPIIAGVTPTAGGLVLTGDSEGSILVLESTTGRILRNLPTGGQIAGGVITYAVAGRQYIAATSGNLSPATYGVAGRPTFVIMGLKRPGEQPHVVSWSVPQSANDVGKTERGARLYANYCASCHGAVGEGHTARSLRGESAPSGQRLIDVIKFPPGTVMPALWPTPLSLDDVIDISAFVDTWRRH